MARYISEFPLDQYEIETVVRFERAVFFFVDSINDHIKNYLRKGEAWEKRISGLIAKYAVPGSVMIDVGAHIGTHTLTMAYCVGVEGRVVAFEPQPKIFRELFHNIRINMFHNVSCIWAAVGTESGRMEISPIRQGNEGATPLVRTGISAGCWSSEVIGGTGMYVDVRSIDSLCLDRVSLIKIDVEGMENMVLEGARETIRKYKPVIILEIMGGWFAETAPPHILEQIEYTKGMVASLGYAVRRISEYDYLALPSAALF